MPGDEQMLRMFYELYQIPSKYRQIIKEIINNNRLIEKTFNQMLFYVKQEKEKRENILKGWEIVQS